MCANGCSVFRVPTRPNKYEPDGRFRYLTFQATVAPLAAVEQMSLGLLYMLASIPPLHVQSVTFIRNLLHVQNVTFISKQVKLRQDLPFQLL